MSTKSRQHRQRQRACRRIASAVWNYMERTGKASKALFDHLEYKAEVGHGYNWDGFDGGICIQEPIIYERQEPLK